MIAVLRDRVQYHAPSERSANAKYRTYLKVVESQGRCVVEVHALVRFDPAMASAEAPGQASGALVAAVARDASASSGSDPLQGHTPFRWGHQCRANPVPAKERQELAKYTTKSVDNAGALGHEIKRVDIEGLALDDHLRRLVKAASDLGGRAAFRQYRLRQWAHTLSCVGRWLSKCPHWSTTFGALRHGRHDYQAARPGESGTKGLVTGHWEYSGTSHSGDGDTWLAESYGKARRLSRRPRWEEA